MKCEMHPNMDAVGNCVYCGRGVCEECKVRMNELVHCKECVENGRIRGGAQQVQGAPQVSQGGPPGMVPYPGMAPTMMPPGLYIVPKPKGPPTKAFFNLGAASSLVCMVMSFITGVLFLLGMLFNYGEHSLVEPEQFFGMMYVLSFALIPLALSYYGFYRNYGSKAAVVGMAGFFSLMPFFYLLWGTYLVQEITNNYSGIGTLVLVISSSSFFGGALLFLTVPLWKFRHYMMPYTPARRNTSAALALMLAASISLAVFFGIFVFGWIILAVALFALFLAFRSAPVPDAPPAQDTTFNTVSSQGLPPGPRY